MSQIVIGKSGSRNIPLDLDVLLRTRLLIQANSGKGKSWLLRRLAEQLFGHVQIIIIDPEGEFATLRENFGFVLVGKGGETPADIRSASLLAHKLLELRAPAVCDLYEMKPASRHEWVQKFLDAMIDAPKELWHPCVVMVDEAHTFCPEKGAGESCASEAMISLATRGRKRGFACIFATQRLGKLRKDAAAELLNVLIGGTFIDIDRKRAADALGVYGSDQRQFFDEIKLLKRGNFFALGPAISDERILVEVGTVETTHPEAGSAKHASAPPPAPEKVKALLPKLADLPKTAEEKAKTESELRAEVRSLKAQLRQPTAVQSPDPKIAAKLNTALAETRAAASKSRTIEKQLRSMAAKGNMLVEDLARLMNRARIAFVVDEKDIENHKIVVNVGECPKLPANFGSMQVNKRVADFARKFEASKRLSETPSDATVRGTPKKMLQAIAEFEAIGVERPTLGMVASWCGIKANTGTFSTYVSSLRAPSYIECDGENIRLTESGRALTDRPQGVADTKELLNRTADLFGKTPANMLRFIHEAQGEPVTREAIGEHLGISHTSGTFSTYISELRAAGMIEDGPDKTIKAASWLYID